MTLVIGTDEAGYGPNLGPLLVAATAWQVDAAAEDAEARLVEAVAAAVAERERLPAAPLIWADSKQVYTSGGGRGGLVRSALAAVTMTAGRVPACWRSLGAVVGVIGPSALDTSPEWLALDDLPTGEAAHRELAAADAASLVQRLAERGVRLAAIACRGMYPGEFNAMLTRGSNKADILSRETLGLAARLAADHASPAEPVRIWCDRHGGRKRYAGVITAAFGRQAEPLQETPRRSAYRLIGGGLFDRPSDADTELEFVVGGESRPPVAVASLVAKLVRELAMEQFNRFWQSRQPGLTPTAGYPQDARRWRDEAADTLAAAGVAESQLWRMA
jgi:hypothetical protein